MSECSVESGWGDEPPLLEPELTPDELAHWRELEREFAREALVDGRAWEFDSASGEALSLRLHALNDRAAVTDADDRLLLAGLRGLQRAKAALAAQELELVAELTARRAPVTDRVPELALRAVADEIAVETGMSRYAATKLQDTSCRLIDRFPATLDALAIGVVDARKAETIADGLTNVRNESVRRRLEAAAIEAASGVTVPGLRELLKGWVLAAEPEVAEERALEARASRRVVFTPVNGDMVELWALLPAEDGLRVRAVLEQTAAQVKDSRTADQRRADVLVDLLTGETTGVQPKTRLMITVPFNVLAGDSEQPAHLDGYGPATALLARRLAADAVESGTFQCAVVDGEHGTLLGLGKSTRTAKYVASAALKDHVQVRDRYCRFPGCRTRASACDFDHRTAHSAGGATCACNGQSLCGHHHRVKHETGWTVRHEDAATLVWRTPGGTQVPDRPARLTPSAPPF
ncbi:DUF222 domain-containing protein [Spongisporangium articulatum]|uniref:DUF222 domain-containing protein n=1 Tax=Spongisporangium articulatum TaxID=3362603 RepID=A0ABW8ARQ7_9ACTN